MGDKAKADDSMNPASSRAACYDKYFAQVEGTTDLRVTVTVIICHYHFSPSNQSLDLVPRFLRVRELHRRIIILLVGVDPSR